MRLGRIQAMVNAGMTQEQHKDLFTRFPKMNSHQLLAQYLLETKGTNNDLVGTVNAGYTIKLQGMLSVIAWSEAKKEYAVWSYEMLEGKPSYFYGRYVQTFHFAKVKHDLKENGEFSG